jgi:hypothetical protein
MGRFCGDEIKRVRQLGDEELESRAGEGKRVPKGIHGMSRSVGCAEGRRDLLPS